ncbi:MAG: nicotinamide-nucleotide amidohydrolase family protein [Treponema sp.]|jgi:PncC family amidohydrolase|nr:nicotinamide-nucleotide amidohydrolase family protein [Treponema sp.]
MVNEEPENPAETLIRLLTDRGLYLAGAESCTAGLASEMLGRVGGASACFWGSFVCYTPRAKQAMLGIDPGLLAEYGLVSAETARAMAAAALEKSGAAAAFSVTGLAGPGGDGSSVPLGTVWIGTALWPGNARPGVSGRPGCAAPGDAGAAEPVVTARRFVYDGGRNQIRWKAAREALRQIECQLKINTM